MHAFVIHALPVAGGILALSPLPGRAGLYAEDIAHLRDWQPALVISLTTRTEMEAHGGDRLGADLMQAGTRWLHLPVADMEAPEPEFHAPWRQAGDAALAALRGRGRVLVHCMGGCGRSGMVALRLMIEAGEAPDAALARLRAIRPCAVETDAQMQWACAARARHPKMRGT